MGRLVKCTKEELEYLDPVMGQLSDGMWENSSRMEAYWMCNSLSDEGIVMEPSSSSFSGRKYYTNPLYDMTDAEVRSWFADKLKAIVKDWLGGRDGPLDGWSRVNQAEVGYLRDGQTVAGAYKVYDSLKGRESKESKQIKIKTTKSADKLVVGDLIGTRKVVRVILPLTRRDSIVTVVYDNDEVERVETYYQFTVTQTKTVE